MSAWNLVDSAAALRISWADRRPTFGGWARIGDSYAAELLGRAGFDWVGIDVQHGVIAPSALASMLQALAVTGTPTFVRVGSNSPVEIMRVLDLGANGVIVPMVNSPEDARAAVRACRYAPRGDRSWGANRAAFGITYDAAVANDAVLCVVMAETSLAVQRIDEIAGVDGVDAVFVGPNDLQLSYGTSATPDPTDLRLERDILTVRDACARHGLIAGIFAGGAEPARRWADAGFLLIGTQSDDALLGAAVRAVATAVRPA